MGDSKFETEKLRIASSLGSSLIDSSQILIGSVGFEAFVNRTLIMDFKNNQLAITQKDAVDLGYDLEYIDKASVDRFPFLLPVQIGKRKSKLFYDTGASMFSLITSNKRLEKLNSNVTDSQCCISNWGKQLPVYRKNSTSPFKLVKPLTKINRFMAVWF